MKGLGKERLALYLVSAVLVGAASGIVLAGVQTFAEQAELAFGEDRIASASDVPESAKVHVLDVPESAIELEWYREHLDKDEQIDLYDAMKAAMLSLRGGVFVQGVSEDEVCSVFWAVAYDHPEIFWVEKSYTYIYDQHGELRAFDFSYSRTDKDEIEKELSRFSLMADTIIAGSGDNVARGAYEWVARATDYGEGPDDQDMASVFDAHRSVCAGYTQALQFIYLRAGIPCTRAGGHSIVDGQPSDGNHTWLVAAPGRRYLSYYDVTWDDQYNSKKLDKYYAIGRDELLETHAVDPGDKAPVRDGSRDDSVELVETAVSIPAGEHLEYSEPPCMDDFAGLLGTTISDDAAAAFEKL